MYMYVVQLSFETAYTFSQGQCGQYIHSTVVGKQDSNRDSLITLSVALLHYYYLAVQHVVAFPSIVQVVCSGKCILLIEICGVHSQNILR